MRFSMAKTKTQTKVPLEVADAIANHDNSEVIAYEYSNPDCADLGVVVRDAGHSGFRCYKLYDYKLLWINSMSNGDIEYYFNKVEK